MLVLQNMGYSYVENFEVRHQFLEATHEQLRTLLAIADNMDSQYERNWDWLLNWCDDTGTTWTPADVVDCYRNDEYWRNNPPSFWKPL